MHIAPCLRNLTSFKNVIAGAALTNKINDWAFDISENAINVPNHFSSQRSSDANCKIKYSLALTSTINRPSGAVETQVVIAKKLIDLLITQGPANEVVT